jgi:hypothetical protein
MCVAVTSCNLKGPWCTRATMVVSLTLAWRGKNSTWWWFEFKGPRTEEIIGNRPSYLSLQCQSHRLPGRRMVGRGLRGNFRAHHIYANSAAGQPILCIVSSLAFRVYACMLCLISFNLSCLVSFNDGAWKPILDLSEHYSKRCKHGMGKIVEKVVRKLSAKLDGLTLKWTFDTLVEDHELGQFFDCILLFFYSANGAVIEDPRRRLARLCSIEFYEAMEGFLGRTLSSNLVSKESDKIRRSSTPAGSSCCDPLKWRMI